MKNAGIGRFMPGPGSARPTALQIDLPDALAIRKHAIVLGQVVSGHAVRVGDGAMMRVMEEQDISAMAAAMRPDAADQVVVVPLMHQDKIRAFEHTVEIQCRVIVAEAGQTWEARLKLFHGTVAVLLDEVLIAPGVGGFVDMNLVATREKLRCDAAQEVGVAMVPVGDQGMVKADYAHMVLAQVGYAAR